MQEFAVDLNLVLVDQEITRLSVAFVTTHLQPGLSNGSAGEGLSAGSVESGEDVV